MSLWDDLSDFGSGALDSVGEGFDRLVKTATTSEQQTVNAGTTEQTVKQADDHGNKVTPTAVQTNDKTLLYAGIGVAALLGVGLLVVLAKN
ncbi:hypothetical protein GTG28_04745 [Vibrio sp. OCN044]|uniref:Uncharacterized protein n=1 Tax=Vibrio tetraodonis subsp. pristinus TaxID=2695891 RepID=A0A6L8LRV9_9VIBR|nr:hypothetical protein [Vibrio tetraodonis]MYM58525.1 hypothetical protein [Vibrio tetraodonis subsp. pristinus]